MNRHKPLVVLTLFLLCNWAAAQPGGESTEPSPEQLDAAFTAEDAAREASAWSNVVIDRSNPDALGKMAAATDLVFRGAVKSQKVVYDSNDLPFTHTTFTILEVLKGAYPAQEITLIYEGGVSRDNPENVVIVSDARYFNVGEEEFLFVELDPENPVPSRRVTVDHRFQIYEGQVYNEDGHGLLLLPDADKQGYRLQWSRDRNPAPRFGKIHIGSHALTKVFSDEKSYPDSGGEEPALARRSTPGYDSSVNVETFTTVLTD